MPRPAIKGLKIVGASGRGRYCMSRSQDEHCLGSDLIPKVVFHALAKVRRELSHAHRAESPLAVRQTGALRGHRLS
jgi:hypothetical protein